jgi:hypothetical protein
MAIITKNGARSGALHRGRRRPKGDSQMHGQIGDLVGDPQSRDLDFYYRTRATLIEAQRGLGGAIDYDFYRMRARTERSRVRRQIFSSLLPYTRPLVAIAVLVAAIFMALRFASDCPACDAPARPYKSMNSNHYLNH